jgi:hypothetical protein
MGTLNRRLLEGGLRLAMVLNEVFDLGESPAAIKMKK